MKKIINSTLLVAFAMLLASCQYAYHKNDTYSKQHDDNAVEVFALSSVREYDPFNPTGVEIAGEFEEFETLRLTVYYENGSIANVEFDNGDIPFSPVSFALPEGKVSCTYDDGTYPPVLRLGTGEALVKMVNNEPVFTFSLDYNKIRYEYKFKAVTEE